MKKNILFLLFFFCIACISTINVAFSQSCDKCVSKSEPITFLGIDYSLLSFEGSLEENDHNKVTHTYYKAWNALFVNESKKYDLAKSFGLDQIIVKSDYFDRNNELAKNINAVRKNPITEEQIKKHVQQLKFSNIATPYALFFIATNYNKSTVKATHYIVLLDTKTKKIIGLQAVNTEPGGFGFRNYWAASFYNILKKEGKLIKKWFN